MNAYLVILAVACGATFDTGERIERRVIATDKLDAALQAEALTDAVLLDPGIEYSHAHEVIPVPLTNQAMALAA